MNTYKENFEKKIPFFNRTIDDNPPLWSLWLKAALPGKKKLLSLTSEETAADEMY